MICLTSYASAGIQESSNAFSRFGSIQNGEESENAVPQSLVSFSTAREDSSSLKVKSSAGNDGGGKSESSSLSSGRRKTAAKKSKPQVERVSFEECVREVSRQIGWVVQVLVEQKEIFNLATSVLKAIARHLCRWHFLLPNGHVFA